MVSLFLVAGLGAGFLTPINPHHASLKEGGGEAEALAVGATDVQDDTMYRPRGSGPDESCDKSTDWILCGKGVGYGTLPECIKACRKNTNCKYWTYNSNLLLCWHAGANAENNRVKKPNCISGRP
jgi:hypothetical protein